MGWIVWSHQPNERLVDLSQQEVLAYFPLAGYLNHLIMTFGNILFNMYIIASTDQMLDDKITEFSYQVYQRTVNRPILISLVRKKYLKNYLKIRKKLTSSLITEAYNLDLCFFLHLMCGVCNYRWIIHKCSQ